MSLTPCAVAAPFDRGVTDDPALDRIARLERRLAETARALRRAEATIALLDDRLAWAEADLAAARGTGAAERAELRP